MRARAGTASPTPRAEDDELIERPSWMTEREISHDEAKLIAQRLINSHFNNDDRAHVSIPANPDRDDDLLILAYIMQQRQAASRIAELKAERERLRDALAELGQTLAKLVNETQPVEHRQGGSSMAHFAAHRRAVDTLIKYGFGS